jgi:transcriptional regulator with XRE-family HTH domain
MDERIKMEHKTKLSECLANSGIKNTELRSLLMSEGIEKSDSTVSAWYCGKRTPALKTMIALSNILGISVEGLV